MRGIIVLLLIAVGVVSKSIYRRLEFQWLAFELLW
jgi:hypothetical protein